MKKKLKYFLSLLWFCYLIVSSIILFTRGFLLTRIIQENNSTCLLLDKTLCSLNDNKFVNSSRDHKYCFAREFNGLFLKSYENASGLCLPPQSKVILLVIDALRYDFTTFDGKNINPLPYENKLPVLQKMLSNFPNSTRLFKFIADPPTTTMQRLKALTTGSLPTFIDAGANFATSEITEDNIIDQANKNSFKVVFMGDDTWASLYPRRFLRNYPYPSFDVWDLDTVDDGVKTNLYPELNNSDWNLLIGHFLGVDHCGHRYGPNHSEMTRKLQEMNEVIKNVINFMDDNTMLFVIGDHGMTITGDHGGESLEEVMAAMFVYSKNPLLSFNKKDSAKQVDLVPTLSTILGIPIPFQNLGILLYSCLPISDNTSTEFESWQLPLFWMWGNVQQVVNYIKTYSENNKVFNQEYLNLYYEEYEGLRKEIIQVDSESRFTEFSQKANHFLVNLRTLCEEVWIQFDPFLMSNGLTFLLLTIFFMFIISDGIPLKYIPQSIEGSFVYVCCIGLLLSVISIAVLYFSNIIEHFLYSSIFLTNILSHIMFLLPIFQNWEYISMNWFLRNKQYGVINFICRIILIFNLCGLFSNSFINEEATVLLFLLVTVVVLSMIGIGHFLNVDQSSKRKGDVHLNGLFIRLVILSLVILGFLRVSMYFWRCRVEQEWCFATPHENMPKSEASKVQWGVNVICLAIFVILTKMWLKSCGNLSGYSATVILMKLIPTVLVVCISGFWVMQRVSGSKVSNIKSHSYLALMIYGLATLCLTTLIIKPLSVFILPRNNDVSIQSQDNIIPQIYNRLKGDFNKNREDVPVVCGLGTAYSAVYVMLGVYVTLILGLILGDTMASSAVVMFSTAVFVVLVTSILRIQHATSIDDLLETPTIAVLGWIILSQYFFYATGHQPAFPNIAWEAAFIGTSGLFNHNFILGTLIIINTFGSYILMGILLPLLVIAPFTLFVMVPSVLTKKKEFYQDAHKGELILFEKDKTISSALFSLTCKYLAGHSVRVFASMLASTIHSRHLMVWNVFAPKFIFEAVAMFVSLVSVLLGYLLFLRITTQMEKLIAKLNKIS